VQGEPDRDRSEEVLHGILPWILTFALSLVVGLAIWFAVGRWGRAEGTRIELGDPWALTLVAGCLLAAWAGFHLYVRRTATFTFSRVGDLGRARRGVVAWLSSVPRVLRVVALGLIVFGLARPQTFQRVVTHVDGIDMMVVLDLSRSMEERDLDRRRNRLHVAKETVRRFLRGRKNDRIGLVVFAKDALLSCPLTLDYGALDTIVADLQIGDIEPQGTAIGDGLGLALASLRRSDAKSKAVVILTDGDSNVINVMSPDEAREKAREMGVRVFTVLAGRESGPLEDPFGDPFGRQAYAVNPALLKQIAADTRGKYFNAPNAAALDAGFEAVRSTLEKTKRREIRKIPSELYGWFVVPALGLLLLEIAMSLTRWRRFP
jgi:Ca-activated chloride channel family protein